jgi:hypothetical protein
MSDPVRLIESLDDEAGRLLLEAGRAGAPSGAKERALAAATAVIAASTLGGGSAAAGPAVAKAASLLSVKWLAVVGLAGVGTVAGTAVVHEMRTAPARAHPPAAATAAASVQPHASVSPVTTPSEGLSTPWVTQSSEPTTTTAAAAAPPVAPSPAAAPPMAGTIQTVPSSFPAELETLDEARAAIASSQPARALSILDRYVARFPRGSMGPEASVLRIEALVAAGDRAAAQRAADAFLRGDPTSPYAARIHSLLGSNP